MCVMYFELCHIYIECVWRDSMMCVTWLSDACDIWYACVTCSNHMSEHDVLIRVTWRMHMCDMTHSYLWHDSCTCVTWVIHMCAMTCACVQHAHICATWIIEICDMLHAYVWHDACKYVTWFVPTCAMTLTYMWCDSWRMTCGAGMPNNKDEQALTDDQRAEVAAYMFIYIQTHIYVCMYIQAAYIYIPIYISTHIYISEYT